MNQPQDNQDHEIWSSTGQGSVYEPTFHDLSSTSNQDVTYSLHQRTEVNHRSTAANPESIVWNFQGLSAPSSDILPMSGGDLTDQRFQYHSTVGASHRSMGSDDEATLLMPQFIHNVSESNAILHGVEILDMGNDKTSYLHSRSIACTTRLSPYLTLQREEELYFQGVLEGTEWEAIKLPGSLKWNALSLSSLGNLILGAPNGMIAHIAGFSKSLAKSSVLPDPTFYHVFSLQDEYFSNVNWVSLDEYEEHSLIGVSHHGIHLQSEWLLMFTQIADHMCEMYWKIKTVYEEIGNECKTYQWHCAYRLSDPYLYSSLTGASLPPSHFHVFLDNSDSVTASVKLCCNEENIIVLGTRKGNIHFYDLITSQIRSSFDSCQFPPILLPTGSVVSCYLNIPDAIVTCSSPKVQSENEWTKRSPFCFGTLGGNSILFDTRSNRVISRLHITNGPVLATHIVDTSLIVSGVSNYLTVDEEAYFSQLSPMVSLVHTLRDMAHKHHWGTELLKIDLRMLRSILHLKQTAWEPSRLGDLNRFADHKGKAWGMNRFDCIALSPDLRMSGQFHLLCTNNRVLSSCLEGLNQKSVLRAITSNISSNTGIKFVDLYSAPLPSTLSTVFVTLDASGCLFYTSAQSETSTGSLNMSLLPSFALGKFGQPLDRVDPLSVEKVTSVKSISSNKTQSSPYQRFGQNLVKPHEGCFLQLTNQASHLEGSLSHASFHGHHDLEYCYLPWKAALVIFQMYSLGRKGYFGEWVEGKKFLMKIHPLCEALCYRDLCCCPSEFSSLIVQSYKGFVDTTHETHLPHVSFSTLHTSKEGKEPIDFSLVGQSSSASEVPETKKDVWIQYLAPCDRRSLLYNRSASLGFFNKAGPSGLEPCSRYPMINVCVQVLRYTVLLEPYLNQHYCDEEACLLCELQFLCCMLNRSTEEGYGWPCQAKNFILSLECLPEARILKLVNDFSDEENAPNHLRNQDLIHSLQQYIPFLFQQLCRRCISRKPISCDSTSPDQLEPYDFITALFGWGVSTTSFCLLKNHQAYSSTSSRFSLKLRMPFDLSVSTEEGTKPKKVHFAQLLRDSLSKTFHKTAFCADCQVFTMQCHKEQIHLVPLILLFDCTSLNWSLCEPTHLPEDIWIKKDQNNDLTLVVEPPSKDDDQHWNHYTLYAIIRQIQEKYSFNVSRSFYSASTVKKTQLGTSNTAHICSVYQGSKSFTNESNLSTPDESIMTSIPDHLICHIRMKKDIPLNSSESRDTKKFFPSSSPRTYFFSPHGEDIAWDATESPCDPPKNDSGSDLSNQDETLWITFNDLIVTNSDKNDVLQLSRLHNAVLYIFYTLTTKHQNSNLTTLSRKAYHPKKSHRSRCIPLDCLSHNVNLSKHPQMSTIPHFVPLTTEETQKLIKSGFIFSLDAEFVQLKEPEDMQDDGHILARVSLLRGEGEQWGLPCLDCHVLVKKEPFDYLTKFSGLKTGDLNIIYSSHWLISRKSLYQKLSFLIYHNCKFIGHGLSKDFHIANTFVPPHQIIDTAQLFRLPGQRLLSLRFLSKYLLKKKIQDSSLGHDSVVDAKAALELYRYYLILENQGVLHRVLDYLYSIKH